MQDPSLSPAIPEAHGNITQPLESTGILSACIGISTTPSTSAIANATYYANTSAVIIAMCINVLGDRLGDLHYDNSQTLIPRTEHAKRIN